MTFVTLLTYADDSAGWKGGRYSSTQRAVASALAEHPDIYRQIHLSYDDLESFEVFRDNIGYFSSQPRKLSTGNCFKPLIIQEMLNRLDFGEYLLYHDVSPEIWPLDTEGFFDYIDIISKELGFCLYKPEARSSFVFNTQHYCDSRLLRHMDLCAANGGILVGCYPGHISYTHEAYTRPNLLNSSGFAVYSDCVQYCTSWVLLRKSNVTMRIVSEWLALALEPDYASHYLVEQEIVSSSGEFVANRGDQSILGLIMLRDGFTSVATNCLGKNAFLQYSGSLYSGFWSLDDRSSSSLAFALGSKGSIGSSFYKQAIDDLLAAEGDSDMRDKLKSIEYNLKKSADSLDSDSGAANQSLKDMCNKIIEICGKIYT